MGDGNTLWPLTPPSPQDGDTSPSWNPRRGGNRISLGPDPLYTRRHDCIDRGCAAGRSKRHHSPLLLGDGDAVRGRRGHVVRLRSGQPGTGDPAAELPAVGDLPGDRRRQLCLLPDTSDPAFHRGRYCLCRSRALPFLPAARSAAVVAIFYLPMITLRLLAPRLGISFGSPLEIQTWTDFASSFVVITGFNVLLTFYVVSAYLDQLCEYLFRTRGVNLEIFLGRFRRKIGIAILYVAFAGMTLLAADIVSYSGDRLLRESTMDVDRGRHRNRLHLFLDQPGADAAHRATRRRHAPGRRARPRGAPAGDVGRRNGPCRQPLQ